MLPSTGRRTSRALQATDESGVIAREVVEANRRCTTETDGDRTPSDLRRATIEAVEMSGNAIDVLSRQAARMEEGEDIRPAFGRKVAASPHRIATASPRLAATDGEEAVPARTKGIVGIGSAHGATLHRAPPRLLRVDLCRLWWPPTPSVLWSG
uniref:Vinculin n=1 Tax=Steinernema glaseri TaxID=37863 RepID=A0A1I7Y721_9BILA